MRTSKRKLLAYLKGKKIENLSFKVETIEGEPKDGYRTFKAGRISAHMDLK